VAASAHNLVTFMMQLVRVDVQKVASVLKEISLMQMENVNHWQQLAEVS